MRMLVSPHLPAVSHPSSRKTLQGPRTRRRIIVPTPRRARIPPLIKRDRAQTQPIILGRAPTQPTIPDLVLILQSPRMLLQIIPNRPLTQQGHWTAPALDVYSTVTSSARRHSSASVQTSPARAYPQTNSSHRRPGARSQPSASSG
jgi:hypothetical protein